MGFCYIKSSYICWPKDWNKLAETVWENKLKKSIFTSSKLEILFLKFDLKKGVSNSTGNAGHNSASKIQNIKLNAKIFWIFLWSTKYWHNLVDHKKDKWFVLDKLFNWRIQVVFREYTGNPRIYYYVKIIVIIFHISYFYSITKNEIIQIKKSQFTM